MDFQSVMCELESLGTEQTKKTYLRHGAREPLFGVTTGSLKPLAKKTGKDQALAMALYDTGNYDACYFAGVIAEPEKMRPEDFEHWMDTAYCHMQGDHVVSVTLAETVFATEVADRWIESEKELYMSAGWSCYCWLLGVRPDAAFDQEKLMRMLQRVGESIHTQPNWVRYAMNNFVISTGTSYLPLNREALVVAERIGSVKVEMGKTACKVPLATAYIRKVEEKGRLGFKRRSVRC